jgi:3-methyladenine DNA glycosylase/8-oxoguanine DNA glycosylase
MNPWDDDGERPPRQAGWGCLVAAIIGSVTTVIAAVIVINLVASTYPW